MDMTDRELLNLIQGPFPMVEQPYLDLAEQLETTEEDVLARLTELKRQNVLRQISAIFDTRRLGLQDHAGRHGLRPPTSCTRPPWRLTGTPASATTMPARAPTTTCGSPLAVPPEHDLEATANHMGRKTGAMESRIMPTIRFFKIGVNFDMVKQQGSSYNYSPDGFDKAEADSWNKPQPVTDWEKDAIRGMQEDLPLVSRPFDPIAERLGITTAELFAQAENFQERRLMRRYSAVLHHRRSGVPFQRHDCLESPAGTFRRGGNDYGGPQGGHPLLRAAHVPRLALHAFHHGSRHHAGGLRGIQQRNL